MSPGQHQIDGVADTALWVAYYRALESERSDSLFKDPFAKGLAGPKGEAIANSMKGMGKYTAWAVISRTVIIDEMILQLVEQGFQVVVNLGAGLDARPYRMKLPTDLKWIEVDYPQMIRHKAELLQSEIPTCELQRVELDLADGEKRRAFLKSLGQDNRKVLVLTEGVIPYLSETQVAELAAELHAQGNVQAWILEYFHRDVYPYLKASLRTQKMKNAPFQFFPKDWLGFFTGQGWRKKEVRYSADIAVRFNRRLPMPAWAIPLCWIFEKQMLKRSRELSGYVLLTK